MTDHKPDTDGGQQMAKFRKKPVEIEAMQWLGGAALATPIINWILNGAGTARYYAPGEWDDGESQSEYIVIDTLEGSMLASPGDWVIRGVQGEFYPCKPGIFEATYEPVAAVPVSPEAPDEARVMLHETPAELPGDLAAGWLGHVDQLECALGGEPIGFRTGDGAMLDFCSVAVAQLEGDTEPTLLCEDCVGWLADVFGDAARPVPADRPDTDALCYRSSMDSENVMHWRLVTDLPADEVLRRLRAGGPWEQRYVSGVAAVQRDEPGEATR